MTPSGQVAAQELSSEYGFLTLISLAIYGLFAFLAARAEGKPRAGVLVGATIALADATLGWLVAAAIGPAEVEPGFVVPVAIFAICVGSLVGLLAGRLAMRASANLTC